MANKNVLDDFCFEITRDGHLYFDPRAGKKEQKCNEEFREKYEPFIAQIAKTYKNDYLDIMIAMAQFTWEYDGRLFGQCGGWSHSVYTFRSLSKWRGYHKWAVKPEIVKELM